MPATVVQDWVSANTGSATSPTSVTVNLGVTATTGNTLLVAVNSDATVTTPSGYTVLASSINNAGCYLYGKISAGSETGVTVAPTSAASTCVAIVELSGMLGATIADQLDRTATGGSSSQATTRSTGTTATTSQADEYAVAVWGWTESVADPDFATGGDNKWASQSNSFVELLDVGTTKTSATNVGLCVGVRDLSATGAFESTATLGGGASAAAQSIIATFEVAAASGVAASGTSRAAATAVATAVKLAVLSGRCAATATAVASASKLCPASAASAAVALSSAAVAHVTAATARATAAVTSSSIAAHVTAASAGTLAAATASAAASKTVASTGRCVAVAVAAGVSDQLGASRAATGRCVAVAVCLGRFRRTVARPFSGTITRPFTGVAYRP